MSDKKDGEPRLLWENAIHQDLQNPTNKSHLKEQKLNIDTTDNLEIRVEVYMGTAIDDDELPQIQIATTCVMFLNGNITKRDNGHPNNFQYAADHFLDHLEQVPEDPQSHGIAKYRKLSDEIVTLFKDEDRLGAWSVANYWLNEGEEAFRLIEVMIGLHGYMSTRAKPHVPWTLAPNRPFEQIAERIAPTETLEALSLLKLSDPRFRYNLAFTFRCIKTTRHLRASAEEFRLDADNADDPTSRAVSLRYQAQVLGELREWDEAIDAAKSSFESFPTMLSEERLTLLLFIADAKMELGDDSSALQASIEALELCPRSSHAASMLIFTANKVGDYSRTVRLIQSLITDDNRKSAYSFIGSILLAYTHTAEFIAFACNETQQLDVAKEAFIAAALHAGKSGNTTVQSCAEFACSILEYQYYKDAYMAIDIWISILRDYPDTIAAVKSSLALAPLYFEHANDPSITEDSCELLRLSRCLTEFSSQQNFYHRQIWTSAAAHISALVGRWYRLRGERNTARAVILPLLRLALDALTDTDVNEHYSAYKDLGRALLCIGDERNAQIAYAFTKPLRNLGYVQPSESVTVDTNLVNSEVCEDTETDVPVKLGARCDAFARFAMTGLSVANVSRS
ncbi:NACHT domain-containing protein [Fusarium austroafricanum]|uniref:NACHT domain-containing protein n=1 Tax=Fusarium austroafricanum TaxID=2364996 RepID=A0A8H4P015_9HYPO|nr:NACHT domain-containing protein [Fusarium austroafricanum]